MAQLFPQEAIDFLRASRPDPAPVVRYDLSSGCLNWDDEHYPAFAALCKSLECDAHTALFAYRTSLIEGRPREEFRPAWDEVRERCPTWIGFRPERMSPSKELQIYLRHTGEEF
jgi:hypothetical protein